MKSAHRQAAQAKRQQRERTEESGLRGNGFTFDIPTGLIRAWYQLKGDVKRWVDNDEPVEGEQV